MHGFELFKHIIDRSALHFISGYGALMLMWWPLAYLRRRYLPKTPIFGKPALDFILTFVVPAAIYLFVIQLREPFDVGVVGDPWWKSPIDTFIHLGTLGLVIWSEYRKFWLVRRWPE